MDKDVVVFGIFSNHPLVTDTEKPIGMGIISYPTLGGLFELYTPEEYEESVNQIKKYMGADHEDVKAMEADLAKLKADNGKGEFVIYKGAFMFSLICWSSPFHIFVIAALFNDSASQ